MRTVSANMLSAITSSESYKLWPKLIVKPSRSYFTALADDFPYDGADYSIPTDTPTGQCMVYSPTNSGAVTFIVNNSTGAIVAMVQGSNTQHSLGLTADSNTKPAVMPESGGSCYLWYWSNGNQLLRVSINMSNWQTSGSTNIEPTPSNWSITAGSPHVLDDTRIVFTYLTSKGGLAASYYDGATWKDWDGRFMSPYTATSTDWSIYSTAARVGNKIFVYSTDIADGEVRGVVFNETTGTWENTFVALPADLSRFDILNARVANGYIHIAGQFHRTKDLENAQVYSLIVRSIDGYTFSWDRFTLLSKLGYQFQFDYDTSSDTLYASDRNSVGETTLSKYFVSVPATTITLQAPHDIIELSGNMNSNFSVRIKGYDEAYLNHAVIKKGSHCELQLGYDIDGTMEYIKYMDFVIAGTSASFADGERMLVISIVPEGMYKTSQIAFPFYAEIVNKDTLIDNCDELDSLYPATGSTISATSLAIDLWKHDGWDGGGITSCTASSFYTGAGEGCERQTWSGSYDKGIITKELKEYDFIKDNPKITATSLNVSIYGWARTDNASRSNDLVVPYLITIDADGTETEVSGTLTSTYGRWPRYYPSTASGDYPIVFQFTGLTVGHKIKYIALKFSNAYGSNSSVVQPERIEVSNIVFLYGNITTAKTWKQTRPSTYAETDPTILEVPSIGTPFVQFLINPYSCQNFTTHAVFEYEAGSAPANAGTVGWGVVGLAEDGANYILARQNVLTSTIQLVLVRDAVETQLASYATSGQKAIMLEHRDGLLTVRYKTTNTWGSPVISHHYDEATNGPISTSLDRIMHVGVWGAIATPGWRHCSVNVYDADGIGLLPGQPSSKISTLSTPGKLVLDDVIYNYTGKTSTSLMFGPWQARNTNWYTENVDQMGCEISHYLPNASSTYLQGYLLCTQNGHSWIIDTTDWTVTHYNAGQPNNLRNRCRHYGDSVNGDHVGTAHRTYETMGVTGVSIANSDTALMHPHGGWAFNYATDKIWVKEVFGTTAVHDSTVRDMLDYMSKVACVNAEFNGDWTSASASLSGTPTQLASTARLFPGGYDIRFQIPTLSLNDWIAIYADNLYIGDPANTEAIDIGFKNSGGNLQIMAVPKSAIANPVYINTTIPANQNRDVRILFHKHYCSVYVGHISAATFAWYEYDEDADSFDDMIVWPDVPLNLYAYASTSYSITNILVCELFDWRASIYIESEMNAASAIGSIIQERPIEILPTTDGGLSFSYNIRKDTITYNTTVSKRILRRHQRTDNTSSEAGSDAIVYFADIAFASYPDFADSEGFITRVLKLSGLDTGAKNAALILLEKANEKQYPHSISMRPDARIELGDILSISYNLSGTGTNITYDIIVEDVALALAEGKSEMGITAREDL